MYDRKSMKPSHSFSQGIKKTSKFSRTSRLFKEKPKGFSFFKTSKCYLKSIFTFTFKNKLQLPNFENYNLYLNYLLFKLAYEDTSKYRKQFPNCAAKVQLFLIPANIQAHFLMFYNIVLYFARDKLGH